MKSVTYAGLAALATLATAQTTTTAATATAPATTGWPGWGWDLDGDGDNGPGPFGGRLDSSQLSVFNSYTSAHPDGPSSGDWSSLTSALGLALPTDLPSGFTSKFGNGGFGGWGYGSGNGGWSHGSGRGGPFGGAGFGGWGADGGEFCSTGSWTSGAWTSWYVSLILILKPRDQKAEY